MNNIINYVETEMRTLAQKKLCAVDSLVLSQLAYVRFEGMVPSLSRGAKPVRIADMLKAEMFHTMFRGLNADNNRALLFALAASPRFRDILMNYHASKTDARLAQQFSAVTFLLGDKTAYIAFRGTDETIVGWKEDFNMAYICPVPSQSEAAAYLDTVAAYLPHSFQLRVGGHSKGGNLATYAALKCKCAVQDRIIEIFNHDGPGFRDEVLHTPEFKSIEGRIQKTLPQASLVGLLLHDQENYAVVQSSRAVGVMQHDPYTWMVGDGDFVYAEKLTGGALAMSRALDQWLGTLPDDRRKQFVDVLFQVLESSDALTFDELSEGWRKKSALMIESVKNIDPELKKFVSRAISDLIRLSLRNLHARGGAADTAVKRRRLAPEGL